jgi:hypothetical protein
MAVSFQNLMPDVKIDYLYVVVVLQSKLYAVKSTCQYVHIFEMNLLEYHTGHKVPVKIYMKIIIRWCTVPVEICAAVLFM